jgi:hypothetical protein
MKRWLRILGITVIIVVIAFVGIIIYWASTAGTYESRYYDIQVGMSESEVQDIMGSKGDSTGKGYRITGDNRQRVWLVEEKGQRLEIVIVFDSNSRVITKEIYKSSLIVNQLLKDM